MLQDTFTFRMAKLKLLLLSHLIFLAVQSYGQPVYKVSYIILDSSTQITEPGLQNDFTAYSLALDYVNSVPSFLQTKGFLSASIDSMLFDSLSAVVHLYLGQQYKWAQVHTQIADVDILTPLQWNKNNFSNSILTFSELQQWQTRVVDHLEEHGHPFARVYLDSVSIREAQVEALLKIVRGPLYKVDSIRVVGDAKISNEFLQQYLQMPNGTIYNKKKILEIDKKLSELVYVEMEKPSDLSIFATGSVLNLYLKPKKNSQVNLLAGFLPNSDINAAKKFQFTIDANILLRNSLGAGETIGLNWQKLQPQSQRLNILYEHPFIFHSSLGLDFHFNMLRQDSSFLNIDMRLGVNYGLGESQNASVFLQRRQSIVNSINTAQVLFTRKLPQEGDVHSNNLGFGYEYNNTNYKLNPQKGNEFRITTSAGTKKIKKNNQVLELKDQSNPSFKFESLYDTVKLKTYQLRIATYAARYFPLGRQSTVKTAIQGGIYSSGNIFRNEIFQIGGYRLLRGFDEESQYVYQYGVGTLEYRYLIGRNSNFFAFADLGWGKHLDRINHSYIGTGVGLSFETKAGIFNLAWALGKRDDTEFNLRQSKVHFGFVNYF